MIQFTIRDILWLTTATGVLLFTWRVCVNADRMATESDEWRSAFLKDRPYRYEYRVKDSDWFPGVVFSPGGNVFRQTISKPVKPITQHWYKPTVADPAKCEICGLSGAYYGIHYSKPLTDDDFPIIPAGD
jgi:hypothetical protein